jgi:hypothetical protein
MTRPAKPSSNMGTSVALRVFFVVLPVNLSPTSVIAWMTGRIADCPTASGTPARNSTAA